MDDVAPDSSVEPVGSAEVAPLPEVPDAWFKAADLNDTGSFFVRRILKTAGDFLTRVGRLGEEDVIFLLGDIDFSASLTVVPLPQSVFVREPLKSGFWFTDTGLTLETVRSLPGGRRSRLYAPMSIIPALRCRSRTVCSAWSPDRLFPAVPPQTTRQLMASSAQGGTQYLVFQHQAVREI